MVSQFCAHCMPAQASSGTAPASSGEVVKISRGAGFWVAMGFYGQVKSSYTFWWYLGSFASSGESRQSSPKLAKAGNAIQVNRITGQVLVCIRPGSGPGKCRGLYCAVVCLSEWSENPSLEVETPSCAWAVLCYAICSCLASGL